MGDIEQDHEEMRGSYLALARFDGLNEAPEFGSALIDHPDAVAEFRFSNDLGGLVLDPDWNDALTFQRQAGRHG